MDRLFIVANLKSNQNLSEANLWLEEFLKYKDKLQNIGNKEIIICPSFTTLFRFNSEFLGTNIKLGVQNLSPFDQGAYTGEVNAKQIKDFADYVIVGHSERRNNFGETDLMLAGKTKMALKYGITPIFCVQNDDSPIPEGIEIVAYEPIFAIGTGNPDTPEDAKNVAANIMTKDKKYAILYGGSVTAENVSSFTKTENIKGVLVGGASLDPNEFIKIILNA